MTTLNCIVRSFLTDAHFAGLLHDIRIYNRALAAAEVTCLYLLESQLTQQPPQTLTASFGVGPGLSLNFLGIPERSYILESATNLTAPAAWDSIQTNTTATNGL